MSLLLIQIDSLNFGFVDFSLSYLCLQKKSATNGDEADLAV